MEESHSVRVVRINIKCPLLQKRFQFCIITIAGEQTVLEFLQNWSLRESVCVLNTTVTQLIILAESFLWREYNPHVKWSFDDQDTPIVHFLLIHSSFLLFNKDANR